jgi:sirohydrochlorin ferrochelatase
VTPSPALVLVAHGSRDPRAADVCAQIRAGVAALAPGVDVRLGFLDHVPPNPAEVLAALPPGPAVLVPLLLATAFHVDVDIAAIAKGAHAGGREVTVAAALIPHPNLLSIADDRLAEAAIGPDAAIVLAAAGTSSTAANAATERIARSLAIRRGTPVFAGYASAAKPTVAQAISQLRADDMTVGVLSWLLAPGRFAAAIADAAREAGVPSTAVLGAHPALARALLDRYKAAANAS